MDSATLLLSLLAPLALAPRPRWPPNSTNRCCPGAARGRGRRDRHARDRPRRSVRRRLRRRRCADLLVGQFEGGLLSIYKNAGTANAPRLLAGVKFQDGRKEGTVPTG
jgi:hypothetical protein